MKRLSEQLNLPVEIAAKKILGAVIERSVNGHVLRARIVEVEAYHQSDAASHSVTGPSGRAKTMFESAGKLYVYLSYGIHFCCNITVGKLGEGAGVLIRAVEPLAGESIMMINRRGISGRNITNGPGKVGQALGIDRTFDGHDLEQAPIKLFLDDQLPDDEIVQSTRVGISKAVDTPWRFYIKHNPYVSKL
ncbi:MAG: DNA-3-methyladenine glycosylase [bacterium]|nr:DNA-3-methyladenine glycosylase [bacterium]MDN5835555.1 DNA-3-methyladenine glycosylase [bacterium]